MYEKLVNYAAKQLELDPSEITPDATFESLGIDSLDIVEMIMDLESELGVELDLEDQHITTFKELADFIESKLN
ncbi:MAG TPA: acyl carrier protein [Clostridiales bacterium]|nr:acyl carrier protein [Clostridiales bacterium]HCP71244.1 acyl carrier protein [Clostridiales bacterium]